MWRDPNFWYIFIVGSIGAWALGKRLYKSYQAQGTQTTTSTPLALPQAQAGGTAQPLALAQVLTYLNDRTDDAPHCFIVGSTGAGKSTFAKLLLAPRVQRGEQYVILTGKRSHAFAGLPCVGRDGVGDYTSVEHTCSALLAELIARDKTPLDQRRFPPLTIVLDDATILLAASDTSQQLFRECALIGREVNMRMMVILGSLRVKELGLEGRGDLREHFAVVTYHKHLDGSRVTTLRPRFDDSNDVPFDASPVPRFADKVGITPQQAWQPHPSDDDLLHGLLMPTNGANERTNERTNGAAMPEIAHAERTNELSNLSEDDLKRAVMEYLVNGGVNKTKARNILKGTGTEIGKLYDELAVHD